MRLQGAIFDFHGTILDDKGNPLPGVDRVLSMMKMEDVWMYLVCDGTRPRSAPPWRGPGCGAASGGSSPPPSTGVTPWTRSYTKRRCAACAPPSRHPGVHRPGGAAGGAEEKRFFVALVGRGTPRRP